jgi:hypothetical protein
VTRTLPSNVFVLVGGSFPHNSLHSPSHWMTVDGDWLPAVNATVVPAPPMATMQLPSFSFGSLINPYAPLTTHRPERYRSEMSALSQEIKDLRSELNQLKEMASREVAEPPPSNPTLRSQSSVGTWAESPFTSPDHKDKADTTEETSQLKNDNHDSVGVRHRKHNGTSGELYEVGDI